MKKDRELYLRYRPKKLEEVLGQDNQVYALKKLAKKGKLPHVILLSGSSGCGKTTIARILARMVGCLKSDLTELNSSNFRGIDMVRDISSRVGMNGIHGDNRGWIIDECHQLTGAAQEAFLKTLEDTPDHVYFFLCTTEPEKLKTALRNRCTKVGIKSLSSDALESLIKSIVKQEKEKLDEEVLDRIVSVVNGSARDALVLLHQIIHIKSKSKQLEIIESSDVQGQSKTLAQLLVKQGVTWKEIQKCLKETTEEPEKIRRGILGYANAIALSADGYFKDKMLVLIDCFSSNYFDIGPAGLTWSCDQFLKATTKRRK